MDASTNDHPGTELFAEFPPVSTEEWDAKIRDDLGGASYERMLVWDSLEGITLQPYYRADDLEEVAHYAALPLTDSTAPPANDWRLRQDITDPDLQAARRHAQTALEYGATDIGFATDVWDDTLRGIPIQTQDDAATLLNDLSVADTPIHFRGGLTTLPLLAFLLNVADQRNVDTAALQGSIDFDPVAALVHGTASDSNRLMDWAAHLVEYGTAQLPHVKTLTADMRPYHDAGASVVQELGFTLAAASELFAQSTERGCSVADTQHALQLVVPIGTSYFLEIAKLRALRLLVPQLIGAYAPERETGSAPLIQAITTQREQTTYDPHVNIVRTTTAAMAAVLGGCDVLTVRPYDAAFEAPDAFAHRIARNTQLILKHEAHFDMVADPAAGSYYVEQLTDKLAQKAWALFQDIEAEGGMLAALQSGVVQDQIAETRSQRQRNVENRACVLVGTNHYPELGETKLDAIENAPSGVPLSRTRSEIALDGKPSLTAIRQAVDEVATLGDVLRILAAGDSAIEPLPRYRASEPFEALRLRTERYARTHEGPPSVFLLPVGDPGLRSARANFARNFFGCAGFAIQENLQFESPQDGAQAALDREADVVVVCSSDAEYLEVVPPVCAYLRDAGSEALVVVAGYPSDHEDDLRRAGVDGFIHRGSPLLETLKDYQKQLGIT